MTTSIIIFFSHRFEVDLTLDGTDFCHSLFIDIHLYLSPNVSFEKILFQSALNTSWVLWHQGAIPRDTAGSLKMV